MVACRGSRDRGGEVEVAENGTEGHGGESTEKREREKRMSGEESGILRGQIRIRGRVRISERSKRMLGFRRGGRRLGLGFCLWLMWIHSSSAGKKKSKLSIGKLI
mgnify:CR=1 FL=1